MPHEWKLVSMNYEIELKGTLKKWYCHKCGASTYDDQKPDPDALLIMPNYTKITCEEEAAYQVTTA